jgi:hypothetical protein
MDIVESSSQRLQLCTGGRAIQLGLLGGVGMLLIGCLVAYLVARTVGLHCERPVPTELACDTTERLLALVPIRHRRMEGVVRASVGTIGDSGDPSYRIELETRTGHAPLSSMTDSERGCAAFAQRFNAFVRSQQPVGDFTQTPSWVAIVVLPVPFAFGISLLLLALPYHLEIDHEKSLLTIRQRLVFKASYPLADIKNICVEEHQQDSQTTRTVQLCTTDGTRIPLAVEPELVDLIKSYLPQVPPPQPPLG